MIKNSGRIDEKIEGKTENPKSLSLENPENIPPMLFSAGYNKDGKVEIKGSFRDITKVEVNGAEVTPVSSNNSTIVIPDNNYNTKEAVITVTNANGSDTLTTLLSNKTLYPKTTDVFGEPSLAVGRDMLIADDTAYYVNTFGSIGTLYYDSEMAAYMYDEVNAIDFASVFGEDGAESSAVISAAYSGAKIYFTAAENVYASNGVIIGIESAFGVYDLNTGETKKLCEIPDETIYGGSLAAYNGGIYLAGGYKEKDNEFVKSFYRYNTSKKQFDKLSADLPDARAYTRFIQYEDKLVGVYGAQEDGKMPTVIVFNGKTWSKSNITFLSDDYYEYYFSEEEPIKVYEGNLGYGNGGVFCNGPYVYGRGDSYTYRVANDSVINFGYSFKNSLDDDDCIGTTLPGCFIAFPCTSSTEILNGDDDDFGVRKKSVRGDGYSADEGEDGIGEEDYQPDIYKLNMTTSYAKLDKSGLKNAKISNEKKGYTYGENAKITLKPSSGYVINSISVNGKVISKKSNSATVRLTAAKNTVKASTTYVAPAKVKGLKASVSDKNVKLSWKKAKNAKGYQIQQYKSGKWKTVKKVSKLSYTVSNVKKGTQKFRVRAYRKYGGKTYYGKWSKTVKAKVK